MGYTIVLIRTGLVIAVLAGIALAGRGVMASRDQYFGLPEAPGREEVAIYCDACHSLRLVIQQGQTRSGWAELLEWMYEEQGMSRLDGEDETLILDYLAKYVGPETQKRRLQQRGLIR